MDQICLDPQDKLPLHPPPLACLHRTCLSSPYQRRDLHIIRIYTPRHFLSLVCLSCPNAERTCAELHHLLPQITPPPATEYTTSCHRIHHLLPQNTPPPATEYTTSCLCRVIHPTTFAIGPCSRGFVLVAIASGRHLYLMDYSIGNDFTIIVSS